MDGVRNGQGNSSLRQTNTIVRTGNLCRYEGPGSYETGIGTMMWFKRGQWVNDQQFTGVVNQGKMQSGEIIFSSGDIYCGEVKDSSPTGQLPTPTDVKPHGKGQCKWVNGNVYTGDYENGKPHGKGTMKWKENDKTYTGDFVEGKRTGNGVEFDPTKEEKYEGGFKDSKRHGEGTLFTSGGAQIVTYNMGELIPQSQVKSEEKCQEEVSHQQSPKLLGTSATNDFLSPEFGENTLIIPSPILLKIEHPNGYAKYVFEGGIYEGSIFDGKPHGKGRYTVRIQQEQNGRLRYTDRIYDGDWVSGDWEGRGKVTDNIQLLEPTDKEQRVKFTKKLCTLQLIYDGEFVKSKSQGKGKLALTLIQDGKEIAWIYNGDFTNDQRTGKGELTYIKGHSAGDVYKGDFVNNIRHGQGRYICCKGWTYTGDFSNGASTGQGTIQWENGTTYVGSVVNTIAHGEGTMTYLNGRIYEGHFSEGKCVKGKLTFSKGLVKGDIYEGNFLNEECHGKGKYTYHHGDVYDGNFENGTFKGRGKLTFSQYGTSFDGVFHDNVQIFGKYSYVNGNIYTGAFKDGLPWGKGVLQYTNKVSYSGEFQKGQPWGKGKLVLTNGTSHEVIFENGKRIG